MAAYPVTLGAWEGISYVGLKAANNIYDKWCEPYIWLQLATLHVSAVLLFVIWLLGWCTGPRSADVPQSNGDAQTDHWFFYVGLSIAVPLITWIIIWIRKSYERFPTTREQDITLAASCR